jgi:hypothetical protein
MCDVVNTTPGSTCTTGTTKPILDFAIHPTDGTLYVLEKVPSPLWARLQVYSGSGASLGVLREWTEAKYKLEFFPH